MRRFDWKQAVLILLMTALVFGVTALARLPFDFTYPIGRDQINAGVYVSLGNVTVYLAVLMLGGPWGAFAAAVGTALADWAVGSTLFIIGDLVIKTGMAFFLAAFCNSCDKWKKCFVIAGIAEGLVVVVRFFFDFLFVQYLVAAQALPVNIAAGVVCGAIGAVILYYIRPLRPDKLPRVRRAPDVE